MLGVWHSRFERVFTILVRVTCFNETIEGYMYTLGLSSRYYLVLGELL